METDSNGLKKKDDECLLLFWVHTHEGEREEGFWVFFVFFFNLKEKEKKRNQIENILCVFKIILALIILLNLLVLNY